MIIEGLIADIVEHVLKDLIKEIDKVSREKNFVVKSLNSPAQKSRFYYKGTLNGINLSKKIIEKRLKELKNDSRLHT